MMKTKDNADDRPGLDSHNCANQGDAVKSLEVGDITVGGDKLVVIGGPCVLEDYDQALNIATELKGICAHHGAGYIFKASYDKGNRGSGRSYRGPMLEEGLEMLAQIRKELHIPVITDVHAEKEAEQAAKYVDALQIPAYLCMQTALSEACGKTGLPVNIKKGQFLHPDAMKSIALKVLEAGSSGVMLTERGTTFGYRYLVSDMTALPIMRSMGHPVVFDATHIVRYPGISSSLPEGGGPEFVPALVRAAVGCGVDALFIETHPIPAQAACDACSMIPLGYMNDIIFQATSLHRMIRDWNLAMPPRGRDGFVKP